MTNDKCAAQRDARDKAQQERDEAQEELQRLTHSFHALNLERTPEQQLEFQNASKEEARLTQA